MSSTAATSSTHTNELKRNALGLPSALAMSLAFISPTIGVIFITALIGTHVGVSSPFAFILGTIGIALMALTLAEFAKRLLRPAASTNSSRSPSVPTQASSSAFCCFSPMSCRARSTSTCSAAS